MKKEIIPGIALVIFALFFALPASGDRYDFYVDAGSVQVQEDGSETYPFKTIGAAISEIRDRKLDGKSIYVKKGTYNEQVDLQNDTDLVGEDRYNTVIDASGHSYGIYFHSTNSRVSNLTIKKASVNIRVNKRSRAIIQNCSVKDSNSNGIEVDHSSYAKKYKFTFKYGSVEDSGKRGMYIFKRKVEIKNSEITGSDEEGIDLHTNLRGTIRDNEIKSNGESGIEMIMKGTKMSIKGNSLSSNDTHGITIQVYGPQRGKIKLTKNSIRNNDGYGVRYARYDRNSIKIRYRDFIKKCVKTKRNTIENNGDGDYAYL